MLGSLVVPLARADATVALKMKRIVSWVVVVVVILVAFVAYQRYRAGSRFANGDVTSQDGGPAVTNADGTDVVSTPSRSDTATAPVQKIVPAGNTVSASMADLQRQNNSVSGAAAPATDTQAANAPNGAVFAGTGHFQVYRQGNLTWRVNTDSGSTCILFATYEEWAKPIVYRHGCGNA